MTIDLQQAAALSIVSLAALSVGQRLWKQIAGFRNAPGGKDAGSGCDGCPSSGKSAAVPLIQIGTRPLKHLRRPPADGI